MLQVCERQGWRARTAMFNPYFLNPIFNEKPLSPQGHAENDFCSDSPASPVWPRVLWGLKLLIYTIACFPVITLFTQVHPTNEIFYWRVCQRSKCNSIYQAITKWRWKVLQYFGNVSHNSAATDAFYRGREGDERHWTVRCRARLIFSECNSPDLFRWFGTRPRNLWF